MSSSVSKVLASAVVIGLLAGSSINAQDATPKAKADVKAKDKHSCKGKCKGKDKNKCKGKDGCKGECKGKGKEMASPAPAPETTK